MNPVLESILFEYFIWTLSISLLIWRIEITWRQNWDPDVPNNKAKVKQTIGHSLPNYSEMYYHVFPNIDFCLFFFRVMYFLLNGEFSLLLSLKSRRVHAKVYLENPVFTVVRYASRKAISSRANSWVYGS